MAQRLKTITRKDGKATMLATRLPDGYKNNLTIADIFKNVFFNEPIKNKVTKSGKSKSKISDYLT